MHGWVHGSGKWASNLLSMLVFVEIWSLSLISLIIMSFEGILGTFYGILFASLGEKIQSGGSRKPFWDVRSTLKSTCWRFDRVKCFSPSLVGIYEGSYGLGLLAYGKLEFKYVLVKYLEYESLLTGYKENK
jgi:hypothetical protein